VPDDDSKKSPDKSPPSLRRPSARMPAAPASPTSVRKPSAASLRIATIDFELANAARRIIEGSLGLVAGERIVLIVDRSRHELGMTLLEVAKATGAKTVMLELEDLGQRPLRRVPDPIIKELETAQASILLCGFEDGEQSMRIELVIDLVRRLGLRHGHMIGVTRKSMLTGFSVDQSRVLDATRAVRTRIRPDSVFKLRTAAGSDLEVKLSPAHRWMEHIGVIRPGRWENLPSGEIETAPGETRGVFVSDASMGGHFGQAAGLLADKPVRLEIEGGHCKAVRCRDLALQREVERFIRSEHNADRVGSVGFGTNVGITAPIGDVSCDQNMPGLHIGLGSTFSDQTGAIWDSRAQITFTCAQGDVDLDGAPLLRHGRYIIT
jgi:leucyl aminopeptidase (aminopeptidase T)